MHRPMRVGSTATLLLALALLVLSGARGTARADCIRTGPTASAEATCESASTVEGPHYYMRCPLHIGHPNPLCYVLEGESGLAHVEIEEVPIPIECSPSYCGCGFDELDTKILQLSVTYPAWSAECTCGAATWSRLVKIRKNGTKTYNSMDADTLESFSCTELDPRITVVHDGGAAAWMEIAANDYNVSWTRQDCETGDLPPTLVPEESRD